MNLTSGSRLGRYEVRSLLGAGGMGEVYLAYDHDLEREVAVKVLGEDGADSPDRTRRFEQEAKAASALNHPNVATVYEIGSHDHFRFIAMELVPGENLRDRLRHGAMPIDEVLAIGTQIAAGLAAAHEQGIVHRDIKPENVIIRPDGYAKVLDFGLAKLRQLRDDDAATLLKTATGVRMGTLGYMAPEQLSGGDVTPAADVFSFGVVLYEMISGRRPFEGATATEVATAILSKSPQPLKAPPKLAAIVTKSLSKNADSRYPTASEMLHELRGISGAPVSLPSPAVRSGKPLIAAIVTALIIIGAIATWMINRATRMRNTERAVTNAERLLQQRAFPEAYRAATSALTFAADDERLHNIITRSSEQLAVDSNPPGAAVFARRYRAPDTPIRLGTTPLKTRMPLADYLLSIEKQGFAPAVRPVPMYPLYSGGEQAPTKPENVSVKLVDAAKVPPDMVPVDAGEYQLKGWNRPSNLAVQLRAFLVDRYEVSNADYEEFVRAGGYRRPELWKTLPFGEVARFRDSTGLPGPRSWIGGAPPAGREKHPVTDVNWHEASAFAAWKGKALPTIYQWEKAARWPKERGIAASFPWGLMAEGVDASDRMNFNGQGTMPVDTMPFGASPYGAVHMAGNVSEWTRNPDPPGYAVRGGSWNDALYTFGRTGAYPAMYSSPELGFRCVKPMEGDDRDQGEFALSPSGFVPKYQPVDDETFAVIRTRYEYAKTPLNARVVETIDAGDWTREKIEYQVAGRTVPAYLYLPKGFRRPLQVVHFSPAGDVYNGWRTLPHAVENQLAPLIRGGRAVFAIVMEGFIERPHPAGFTDLDTRSPEFVDYTARLVTEMRRGIDYLETRRDVDASKMAFLAVSAGSWQGVILAAVENRYRSVLFIGTGIKPNEVTDTPAANRINFVPHIAAPKLMLQGRYDESAPLQSNAEPLYHLMREPKRLELFEGGHVPSKNIAIPAMTRWFDQTLGRVE